jgi:hypothetical protein
MAYRTIGRMAGGRSRKIPHFAHQRAGKPDQRGCHLDVYAYQYIHANEYPDSFRNAQPDAIGDADRDANSYEYIHADSHAVT